MTIDTTDLTDALATLPDAALRIVMGAASESPEMMRRAALVARMRLESILDTDPNYLRAVEDCEVLAVLILQRAQLQTEKELRDLAAVIVRWAIKIAAQVLAAAV